MEKIKILKTKEFSYHSYLSDFITKNEIKQKDIVSINIIGGTFGTGYVLFYYIYMEDY